MKSLSNVGAKMSEINITRHPLLEDKLYYLRKKKTSSRDFAELVDEIALLLAYEATRDLELVPADVETPVAVGHVQRLSSRQIVIVPILRAGLGMVNGMRRLMPRAKVGHIGLYRDEETLQPIDYYFKMPQDVQDGYIFIVDPMLATGGSAVAAIQFLKDRGYKYIRLISIISAPEGLAAVQKKHPDVDIYTAAIDDHLNKNGYIVPGLGDAGDRIFGTN